MFLTVDLLGHFGPFVGMSDLFGGISFMLLLVKFPFCPLAAEEELFNFAEFG